MGKSLGGQPNKEKQQIANELDEHLRSYGFRDVEIKNIKSQYVGLIGLDIKNAFEQVLSTYLIGESRKQENGAKISQWLVDWSANKRLSLDKIIGLSGPEMARTMKAELPSEFLTPDDITRFEVFAERTGEIYAGCVERGGYTTEAINFIDEFSSVTDVELVNRALQRR